MNGDLLTVRDLRVAFDLPEGVIEAVRGVSFSVKPGSTVALVGESGSGKTVVSQAIMGILPKSARITGGSILFDDPENKAGPVDVLARLADAGRKGGDRHADIGDQDLDARPQAPRRPIGVVPGLP